MINNEIVFLENQKFGTTINYKVKKTIFWNELFWLRYSFFRKWNRRWIFCCSKQKNLQAINRRQIFIHKIKFNKIKVDVWLENTIDTKREIKVS